MPHNKDNRYRAFNKNWFNKNQKSFISLLNHKVYKYPLRVILDLVGDVSWSEKICQIEPNNVKVTLDDKTNRAIFFTTNKFSKLIYFRFKAIWKILHKWDELFADKYLPELSFGFATLIVYPDADPESTSVDGFAQREIITGTSFSAIKTGDGTYANSNGDFIQVQVSSDALLSTFDHLSRGIVLFDTSSLASNDTITSASLGLFSYAIGTDGLGDGYNVSLVTITEINSLNGIIDSDYELGWWDGGTWYQRYGTSSMTTDSWTRSDYSPSSYSTKSLNQDGIDHISTYSTSKFGLRLNWDIVGSGWVWEPSSYSGLYWWSADGSSTKAPKLTINYTSGNPPPVAAFHVDDTTPTTTQTVIFTDDSTNNPTSWLWLFDPTTGTFMDGTDETWNNPHVRFNSPGLYDVALRATNAYGFDIEAKYDYISVTQAGTAPVADFVADDTTPTTSQDVSFTDLSINSPTSWLWYFSPGSMYYVSGSATSQHPVVRFVSTGQYLVRLTATNAFGNDIETKTDYITVGVIPIADFWADDTTVTTSQLVSFYDDSTQSPTSWSWEFDPGSVTYNTGYPGSQNPKVYFNVETVYTVTLTATNNYGSGVEEKVWYISVNAEPVADFHANDTTPSVSQQVYFYDDSTNSPTSWSWTFLPSTITYIHSTGPTSQDPHVEFNATGFYTVILTSTNSYGYDTEQKTNYIDVSNPPVADFHANDTTPTTSQTVLFTDDSTNSPISWTWGFSPTSITYLDGTNLTSQNPHVRFDTQTLYTVTLTATNNYGNDVEIKTDYINAFNSPVAEFHANDTTPTTSQTVIFTDDSTNTPTSWLWTFAPTTVTYISGNQTSQNPSVRFNQVTLYTVTLKATNSQGFDEEIKINYINVSAAGGIPVAEFIADDTTPVVSQDVYFTDLSTNIPTSWSWDITPTSFAYVQGTFYWYQNPIVEFYNTVPYDVTLTVSNVYGGDSEVKLEYINPVDDTPVADFVADDTTPTTSQNVQFTDLSTNTPTSWLWVFDPGSISYISGDENEQNPIVRFNSTGTYDVTLTATNSTGNDDEIKLDYITVGVTPIADFWANDTTPVIYQTVFFTDDSTQSPTSWLWEFSGSITYEGATNSGSQNPEVSFNSTGYYTVTLTATNDYGSDEEEKINYILVSSGGGAPVADFIADDVTPSTTQTVIFTDLSTNTPTSWSWAFSPGSIEYKDSTNSTSQNPHVRFVSSGPYDVTLTSTNSNGSDDEIKLNYINASTIPIANFSADDTTPILSQIVLFTDSSTNIPTSWLWEFLPTSISYESGTDQFTQDPEVSFNSIGYYTVTLTATNSAGSDDEEKIDYILVSSGGFPPSANFIADDTTPTTDDTVEFTDLSKNGPTSWAWEFSPTTIDYRDGTDQNTQHPHVQFNQVTSYTVTLTATNSYGSDDEVKIDYIVVSAGVLPPIADFIADDTTPFMGVTIVLFTDLSINSPTSWSWVFSPTSISYEDGTNSTTQNPHVIFNSLSPYTVTLTATNFYGSDDEIKIDYINPILPPTTSQFVMIL